MTKTKTSPRRILMLGALVGAMALGGAAFAHPGGGGKARGMRAGGPAAKMLRAMGDLDLSEAQEVQLVRIRRELRKEHKALRTSMKEDRKTAFAEMKKDSPNPQLLHDMLDRHAAARTALAHKALDRALTFHRNLTPAQKAQLTEKMQRFEKRMKRRGQRFDK